METEKRETEKREPGKREPDKRESTAPWQVRHIAHIHTDFAEKFGIPRQSGLIGTLQAQIIFEPDYRDEQAVKGLEEFSHLWLLWEFSKAIRSTWSPTVLPPRLGGNVHMGVFATRSPFRPNPIGLSSVRLDHVELSQELGPILHVRGADLLDGTPILDIKPYLTFTDCHPDAVDGFADRVREQHLEVIFPEELLAILPENKREAALQILAGDPRPGYQDDPARRYGVAFAGFDIRFHVQDGVLTVCEVAPYRGGRQPVVRDGRVQ